MFEKLLEAVSREVSGARAHRDLSAVTRFHRIQSSPGYGEAADWLAAALGDAGLTPERVEVPGDGRTRFQGFPMPEGWRCRHARAELVGARGREPLADFARAPLSIVQRSDSAHGRHPLVALASLDALADTDVRGKIVLTSAPAQRAHERAVVARGAAGLVHDGRRLLPPVRTEEHDRDSLAYTSFWWLEDRPRGFGIVVSPARGAELRRRLADGERLDVEVDFACERMAASFALVSAVIPGTLPGEVLLTSHLCHPRPGANDNASGVAATLECARVLCALVEAGSLPEPRRTLRFLWMPEFTGTFAWQGLRPERVAATVAALNLDMVGARQEECGSTLLLERAPYFLGSFADELLGRILHAAREPRRAGVAERPPLARVQEVPYSGGSDHAAWLDPGAGVPCPMLIQWPDRYYHSDLDTPEHCDPESLALAVRAGATYAAFLALAGAEHARWLAQQLVRGAERRLRLTSQSREGREATLAELERSQRALASLARLAAGTPEGQEVARALAPALDEASERLDAFFFDEIRPALPRPAAALERGSGRVPERRASGLVCPMRWLAPGWDALPEPEQERLLALEAGVPGGSTGFDVAWFACDGTRDVGTIAEMVAREGWPAAGARLEEWFELAVSLDLCRWRETARG